VSNATVFILTFNCVAQARHETYVSRSGSEPLTIFVYNFNYKNQTSQYITYK